MYDCEMCLVSFGLLHYYMISFLLSNNVMMLAYLIVSLLFIMLFASVLLCCSFFFFQAEDGIRDIGVTGVQTCALPICRPQLEAAVRGIARVHAIGYGSGGWQGLSLPQPVTTAEMTQAMELWTTLEHTSRECFTQAAGTHLPAIHRQLLRELEHWWEPLERLPRTLIHNDFNPRNIALRREGQELRLCAYDWELAT